MFHKPEPCVEITYNDATTFLVKPKSLPRTTHQTLSALLQEHGIRRKYIIAQNDTSRIHQWCRQHKIECRDMLEPVKRLVNRPINKQNTPTKLTNTILWSSLFPYQQEGVKLAITTHFGKCLLADDMGLGKTYQALTFMDYYRDNTPILIVCPSYLRCHWVQECQQINMEAYRIKTKKDKPQGKVWVLSYDMLKAFSNLQPMMVIADESHYIKNRRAQRAMAFLNIIKRARYRLLLTGTPALNRPIEFFTQMYALRPKYVKNYSWYAKRYCNAKMTHFGFDDRGVSNPNELSWLLKQKYMVRRLKRDVLTQLPPKTRREIQLQVNGLGHIKSLRRQLTFINKTIHSSNEEEQKKKHFERKRIISEMFRETAKVKAKNVAKWLMDRLEAYDEKIVFFGYHQVMLDMVETLCSNVEKIRIDGSTSTENRQAYVNRFQDDPKVRLAVLSLMAAGTGLTLTASSTVVFGEMYWVPGVILQAEDRCHRISQTQPVTIYYLLGQETIDTYIHPVLDKKLKVLDNITDQRADRTLKETIIDLL